MKRLRTCLHDDPGHCAPKVPEVLTRLTKVPSHCLVASDGTRLPRSVTRRLGLELRQPRQQLASLRSTPPHSDEVTGLCASASATSSPPVRHARDLDVAYLDIWTVTGVDRDGGLQVADGDKRRRHLQRGRRLRPGRAGAVDRGLRSGGADLGPAQERSCARTESPVLLANPRILLVRSRPATDQHPKRSLRPVKGTRSRQQ